MLVVPTPSSALTTPLDGQLDHKTMHDYYQPREGDMLCDGCRRRTAELLQPQLNWHSPAEPALPRRTGADPTTTNHERDMVVVMDA